MVKMFFKGWRMPVIAGPELLKTGWYGGQWVRFVGNLTVEKATPSQVAGFLLNGYKLEDYDGKPYSYKDMDGKKIFVPFLYENQTIRQYGKVTMATDDGLYDFNKNVYEDVDYQHNQYLYLNNEGILTNVDSGFAFIGVVAGIPVDNNGWLRVLVRM